MENGIDRKAAELARTLLAGLEQTRASGPYFVLPTAFTAAVGHFAASASPTEVSAILRRLLLDLLDRASELEFAPYRLRLPDSIRSPLAIEQARMRVEWADGDAPASLSDDLYVKDLGVVTFRLLPGGAQLVDVNWGIPRSAVTRARSIADGFSAARYVLQRCGGFRPAVEIHTSSKTLHEFTEEGWRRCYLRIADLMELNPAIRAMYGLSWFYDPELARVSPRLAYLQDEPQAFGARLLFWGHDEKSVANALATSPTRRRMFEAGEYRPAGYMLVWSREDMLEYRRKVQIGHP